MTKREYDEIQDYLSCKLKKIINIMVDHGK